MMNRKKEMEEHRAALEKWAGENGVDVKYLMGGFGKGKGPGGLGDGMGRGPGKNQKADSSSDSE